MSDRRRALERPRGPDRATARVDHHQRAAALGGGESAVEHVAAQRPVVAPEADQERPPRRALQHGGQHHAPVHVEVAPPAAVPESLGDLGPERGDDRPVLRRPADRVEHAPVATAQVDRVEERVAPPPRLHRLGTEGGIERGGLDVRDAVLLRADHRHLDLLGRHQGRVARLLAELPLRGLLPAPEREVAERGQHQRRGEDRAEDQEREAGSGHAGSSRRRWISCSISA